MNPFNCSGCDYVLSAHITLTTLSTRVVFDSNKVSNSLGFCGNNTEYLYTPLYNLRLKPLLGFNFKIIIKLDLLLRLWLSQQI